MPWTLRCLPALAQWWGRVLEAKPAAPVLPLTRNLCPGLPNGAPPLAICQVPAPLLLSLKPLVEVLAAFLPAPFHLCAPYLGPCKVPGSPCQAPLLALAEMAIIQPRRRLLDGGSFCDSGAYFPSLVCSFLLRVPLSSIHRLLGFLLGAVGIVWSSLLGLPLRIPCTDLVLSFLSIFFI